MHLPGNLLLPYRNNKPVQDAAVTDIQKACKSLEFDLPNLVAFSPNLSKRFNLLPQ